MLLVSNSLQIECFFFGMTFPKLPKEMNITFSRFIYFPGYFALVIIISGVLGVHIQSLCSFIVTIRFMLHSTGLLSLIQSLRSSRATLWVSLISDVQHGFYVVLFHMMLLPANLLLLYSICLCPTLKQCS